VELLQKHVSRYDESALSRLLLEVSLLESAYRNDGEPAPFAPALLYAALLDTHPAAYKESLVLEDLAKDQWILFAKRVHPLVYETRQIRSRKSLVTHPNKPFAFGGMPFHSRAVAISKDQVHIGAASCGSAGRSKHGAKKRGGVHGPLNGERKANT
jgi:hypothetical protein